MEPPLSSPYSRSPSPSAPPPLSGTSEQLLCGRQISPLLPESQGRGLTNLSPGVDVGLLPNSPLWCCFCLSRSLLELSAERVWTV